MAWIVEDLKLRSGVDRGVSWNPEDLKLRSGADRDTPPPNPKRRFIITG